MAIIAMGMLLGLAMMGLVPEVPLEGSDGDEKYSGTDDADYYNGAGGNDLIIGHAGDDTLEGAAGDDWLIGLMGDDALSGASGDDVLIGGTGSDTLSAGAGDDFVEAANILNEEALQASLITANSFSEVDFAYALPATSDAGDNISLGAGDDTVVLGSDDTVESGEGSDELILGDWIEVGKPAVVEDFDSAEDVIVFTYSQDGPVPEITIQHDTQTNTTEFLADGQVMARLENSIGDVSLSNLHLAAYA